MQKHTQLPHPAKTYTIATSGKTIPYTTSALRDRGTVTYGKSNSSYIDNAADELYILDAGYTNGVGWLYVSYPTSNGRVKAYIPMSTVTKNNGNQKKYTSSGKFYCSVREGWSNNSSYYVAKNDTVYLIAEGNSKYQILYNISNGCYRLAWCNKADFNKYCTPQVTVSSVSIRNLTITLRGKGISQSLYYTVYPSNATNKALIWKSSNTAVATVSASGKVTSVGAGTAYITATSSNGKKATAKVTVNAVAATKITVSSSAFTLSGTGATKKLSATLAPSNTTDKVTWSSSNTSVAKVSSSGTVTAVKNGTAVMTARTTSGKTVTIKVTCKNCNNWDAKVGKTVASIKSGSSYTKWYNASGNLSAEGGYYGQCTWYAYGRFYEVNNIRLSSAPNAKKWLTANKNDNRLTVLTGKDKIRPKSIAVRTTGTYGHVMFIEHVTYDANGNPKYVYFTECNSDNNGTYNAGKDCILQKMTYSSFISNKNPAGYICKK